MLKQFGLQEDWTLIRVLRCTRHHSVLLLRNKKTGVPEVIKVISKHTFNSTVYEKLSNLSDKNLIPITKIQTYHNWKIVFSPLLTPLTEYVQKEGLSLPEILRLTEQISTAISAMHEKGLLHLDISPSNIFLNEEGDFFLGDFCHARQKKDNSPILSGTPDYCAPECSDKQITSAADQYSFAVLLFALLHNGSVPNIGQKNICNSFSKKLNEASKYSTAYPTALYQCFEKALSPTPSQRYDSVSLFAAEICSCLSQISKESTYRLQITDCDDAFLQIHTQLFSLHKKVPFKIPHKCTVAIILILLCIGFTWKLFFLKKTKTSFESSMSVSSSDILVDAALPATSSSIASAIFTPAASDHVYSDDAAPAANNKSQILDISNQNADTMAELFDESLLAKDWNILYGENNHFSNVDELTAFPNMRELYLSGNRIDSLDAIASLEHLEIAILSDNQCTDVQPLCSLTNLSVLDLSGNRELSQIACLEALSNLQLLILSDTSVPDQMISSLQSALPNCEIVH